MHKFNKIIIAISLLTGSILNVSAQTTTQTTAQNSDQDATIYDYNPSWYVAPSLGWLDADKQFNLKRHGEAASVRFGKPISPSWDLQFGTSYGRQTGNVNQYRQNTLGLDALYMLSRSDLRPYLMIGVGSQRDKLVSPLGRIEKTSPYVNAGVGIQMAITEQLALNIDLRRVHGFVNQDNSNPNFKFDRARNNYLTVGLSYAFDAPNKRPAYVPPAPTPEPIAITETRPEVVVAPVAPKPVFEKIVLSTTELFAFNSAKLLGQQTKLDEIGRVLTNTAQTTPIVIAGYADRLGSDKYNLKLSQERAEVVRDYLVGRGVAYNTLSAQGRGESNPVVECHQKKRADLIVCLEPNRRVEIEEVTIERRVK